MIHALPNKELGGHPHHIFEMYGCSFSMTTVQVASILYAKTAYLPAQLLKYDDAARRILGNGDTVVFASRHLPSLLELTPSLQQTMPIQFAKDLFFV